MPSQVISTTEFKSLKLKGRGKVRDIYDLGDRLLIIATDRISAFDVIMPAPVPDKGRVLTQLSKFWFRPYKGDCFQPCSFYRGEGLPPRMSTLSGGV